MHYLTKQIQQQQNVANKHKRKKVTIYKIQE